MPVFHGVLSNALYKIQEEGLMPTMKREYTNVKYREGEKLHYTSAGCLVTPQKPLAKGSGFVIAPGKTFRVGNWENKVRSYTNIFPSLL